MLELIFAFLMGLACPGHTTATTQCHNDNTTISTQGDLPPTDTGGEGGHYPPKNP